MSAFLSIITINYNNAKGLQKTIDSVLGQTYIDFEYIVIDGNSTDGSKEVLEKYKERITYSVSEKDSGIYNAMNKGIQQAKGTYLQFLNSGDVFTSANALDDFIKHPDFEGDIIYGDYTFEKGEKVYPDVLTPLFFMKSSLPHQSTFFKKSIFDEMGGYDETYSMIADRVFFLKAFLTENYRFTHIKYPLTLFDFTGFSNDPAYKEVKDKEDEQMFEECFGIYATDLKNNLKLQQELNRVKRDSLSGILKRIKKRLFR